MTQEGFLAKLAVAFPKVEKDKTPVKDALTLRLPGPGDLVPVVSFLKDELGFDYLDMVTAVDWKGPVDLSGYIREPNPNVFLPEGATPEIEGPKPTPGVAYRDAFEVVYLLTSLADRLKVFLKVDVPRSAPRLASLAGLYKTADWQERETFDLLGVVFEGHPNLKKILTPDFTVGHPLRKDYVHVKDRYDA